MTIARLLCAAAAAALLAGCAINSENARVGGELADATAGNLLGAKIGDGGNQLATTAAGTLLGPYSFGEIGKSLDPADRRHAEDVAAKSLTTAETGSTAQWVNPASGHSGTFTPINVYQSSDGLRCRDYDQSVTVEAITEDAYGTACLAEDGSWRIVETPVRRALRRKR